VLELMAKPYAGFKLAPELGSAVAPTPLPPSSPSPDPDSVAKPARSSRPAIVLLPLLFARC
jgi:hypothetical protein